MNKIIERGYVQLIITNPRKKQLTLLVRKMMKQKDCGAETLCN